MSEHKHTPGPWTLGKGKYRVRTEDGTLVAECYTTGNYMRYPRDKVEQNANAHLIAAAPDLLEALIEARETIQKIDDATLDCGGSWQFDDEKIDVAIAKAKGESSLRIDNDGQLSGGES